MQNFFCHPASLCFAVAGGQPFDKLRVKKNYRQQVVNKAGRGRITVNYGVIK